MLSKYASHRTRSPNLWVLIAILASVFSLALGFSLGAFWYTCKRYETMAIGPRETPLPPTSAHEGIVVLAGDAARIPLAVKLLKRRESPYLLISGAQKGIPLRDIINRQGEAAVDIHENWAKLDVESLSKSTVQNAKKARPFLEKKNIKRLLLITSDYHMHRSLSIFAAEFPQLEIIPVPVVSRFSTLTFSGTRKFFFEYIKYLAFSLGIGRSE